MHSYIHGYCSKKLMLEYDCGKTTNAILASGEIRYKRAVTMPGRLALGRLLAPLTSANPQAVIRISAHSQHRVWSSKGWQQI